MKWREHTCDICGVGSSVYAVVQLALPADESEHPYTETSLCERHWREFGIQAALDHNAELREKREASDAA